MNIGFRGERLCGKDLDICMKLVDIMRRERFIGFLSYYG